MYHCRMTDERPLTRLTVNLIPKAAAALNEAALITEDNRTDCLNRAIQVYAFLMAAQAAGGKIYVGPNSRDLERVHLL
jgi:hypothetical protein